MKLTPKQQAFADYYIATGNADESARRAGYSPNTARGHAHKLLQNVSVATYIREKNNEIAAPRIATMEEVKRFWTETMKDSNVDHRDRLKASEYIAKTNAAFIERHEHSGNIGVQIMDDVDEED